VHLDGGTHAGVELESRPDGMIWHVPAGAASHRRQGSVQAVVQQTLSMQNPDAHSLPAVQAVPAACLSVQVPPGPLQAWPIGQEATWQQWPSLQFPVAHSRPSLQDPPAERRAVHRLFRQ
jgi:hypothetical protein